MCLRSKSFKVNVIEKIRLCINCLCVCIKKKTKREKNMIEGEQTKPNTLQYAEGLELQRKKAVIKIITLHTE